MMKLNNLNIGIRLVLGFGLILLFLLFIMLVGIKNMATIQDKLDRIYNVNNVRITLANYMLGAMSEISLETRNILLLDNQEAKRESKNRIEDARARYREAFSKLIELDNTEEGKAMQNKVEEALKKASSSNNKVIELGMANKFAQGLSILVNESGPAMAEVDKALKELVKYQESRIKFRYEEACKAYAGARAIMIIFSGIAIVLGLIISWVLTRAITKPVAQLVKVTETASTGDLTAAIPVQSNDEIGKLARAFGVMVGHMRELVGEIIEKANNVSGSAQQLNSSSQKTTASANENAATMNEISTAVEQISSNIQEVSAASEAAAGHAGEGSRGIDRVSTQMKAIASSTREVSIVIDGLSQKSQEINQIVEIINNIAEQTNLLALNAAIEAARAGDQGRGFAVVAEEVRKLAEKSAGATKEIKDLINAIQVEAQKAVSKMAEGGRDVEAGTMVVEEVGESFKEIINAIQGLTGQIQEVASATEQVSSGVQNVAASTEEQTASMEEVLSSAESLSQIAVNLNALVGKFKV